MRTVSAKHLPRTHRSWHEGVVRRLIPGAVLALALGVASSSSRANPGKDVIFRLNPAAPPPAAASQPGVEAAPVTVKNTEEKKKDEKLHAFNMDKKPWGSVFAWLSERTGKPVIASAAQPTGTFSFTSPPGKRYSIPEVIDIINDGLLGNSATQKFYMINRERNFTVVPADEKVDPALLPRILPEDLEERGRTELVQLIMTLKALDAEQQAPEVKRMMGPFGEVSALTASNSLLLQDTVSNLRRIKRTLDLQEQQATGAQANQLSYECKFIKASEAERILKDLMGDGKATTGGSSSSSSAPASGPPAGRPVS
ncbi:MAG: hypothetical protein ACKO23_16195, partial [Gemmataceae bacterium]